MGSDRPRNPEVFRRKILDDTIPWPIPLLDEPETALSPKSQLELLKILINMGQAGHAQFIIATHSPILLAASQATIYSFDDPPVKQIEYEETQYYRIYKDFMTDRTRFLK